jgi:hydroxymethylpyrimidine/phosphomethylpyrimidine kinase
MRAVLTIAGSDSIAGAGLQADLKTFAALGVYGTSAVTAVTSQNTSGIHDVFAMPPHIVRSQIEMVAQDVSLAAVKTGMLATAEIALVVAEAVGRFRRAGPEPGARSPMPLIVDPVMTAGNPGRRTLLSPEAVEILKTRILPVCTVVTPNTSEAGVLSGIDVRSLDTAREAAKKIFDLGPLAVIVKGGHVEGREAIDLLYDGKAFTEFPARRSSYGSVHGTGCAFASAIAAGLALGDGLPEAVQRAKTYVTGAIEHSFELGAGARLLNHFWIY